MDDKNQQQCNHVWVHMKGRALFDNEVQNINTLYCPRCYTCLPVPADDKKWTADDILTQYGHKPTGKQSV